MWRPRIPFLDSLWHEAPPRQMEIKRMPIRSVKCSGGRVAMRCRKKVREALSVRTIVSCTNTQSPATRR